MNYFDKKNEMIKHAKEHVEMLYKHYPSYMADSISHSTILDKNECEKLKNSYIERKMSKEGTLVLLNLCTIKDAIFEFERPQNRDAKSVVLNFASFKHPGGMFLKGSSAQEESLCHCSTLYPVLKYHSDFYERHLNMLNHGLYETEILYTPNIIFMDTKNEKYDNGSIETTVEISCNVLTCAAPNAGAARKNGIDENTIEEEMMNRIGTILEFCDSIEAEVLYLGAYGCGVFKNDTVSTAIAFKEAISKYNFKEIIFPIPDRSTFLIFNSVFFG